MRNQTERSIEGLPNNYIDNNYFFKKDRTTIKDRNTEHYYDPYPPEYAVKKSIDFLTLSIKEIADQHTMKHILTSIGFKSIDNRRLYKGNYGMKWSFKNLDTGITVEVFYAAKYPCIPSLLVKVHDPDQEILNQLHHIFLEKHIHPNLSFLELTFDFFTSDKHKMRRFLVATTLMKNARSKPGSRKTTYYPGDTRKSVRGMRIYPKPEVDSVRMEVTLKKPILKRLGISFPLNSLDLLDLNRFFEFKYVDQEQLGKYLIRRSKKHSGNINPKYLQYNGLFQCHVNSWINSIVLDDAGDLTPLMDQIHILRGENGVPNYSRFLRPLTNSNVDFMKKINGQIFLQ